MHRRLLSGAIAAAFALTTVTAVSNGASATSEPPGPLDTPTDRADAYRLDQPVSGDRATARSGLDPALVGAEGSQLVSVRLTEAPVATEAARGRDVAAQRSRRANVERQQTEVVDVLEQLDPGLTEVATITNALNAVIVEADIDALVELADDPRVISINRVRDYELDLSDTVPYIGASAVQEQGVDGSGVTVAVFDSGLDFTHAAFGGPGTLEAYDECYGVSPFEAGWSLDQPHNLAPTGLCADFFGPDAPKVKGGFDFVGELWPFDELLPNPNPIDLEGHGTHVADIIAGENGVAPGADLIAVKVCSAVSSSCSGVALLQGMDFALDPNGDGDLSDRVDLINMSLGANYGQAFDDDLSAAVDAATAAGVLTVASAGNSSDKPFITGTPAAAPTALSVAQTEVPSSVLPLLEVVSPDLGGPFEAVFQPWSPPLTETIEAPLQYGDGAGGNLLGCDPFAPGSLDGLVVLVDRGVCAFSEKMANVTGAGAEAGIIGLVAPGEPFTGGFGGGEVIAPSFMISQTVNNLLKGALGGEVIVRFDPSQGIPLVQHMVGSSSRGPSMLANLIKPEIGAPGASISAVAGSGDGTEAFGGTSGAAPMVTGSAALVLQAHPDRSPLELKSVLVNTGETEIFNRPAFFGGDLAPISRIGGGEVRVDRALGSTLAAWVEDSPGSTLSFGFHEVTSTNTSIGRTVVVRNYSNQRQMVSIAPSFRFAADAATGAVEVRTRPQVNVPANGTARVDVTLRIDPTRLPAWALDSGLNGANGDALTAVEFDGYLTLTGASSSVHVPWHVLPRAAGDVRTQGGPTPRVRNQSVNPAVVESYHLVATSPEQPTGGRGEQDPRPDLRFGGYATFAGACGPDGDLFAFAVNTWERQTHANAPALLSAFVDVDGDGVPDYEVFSAELGLLTGAPFSDGRNLAWVADLQTGAADAFFFTDHDTNSANTVLYACSVQFGGAGTGEIGEVGLSFAAFDLYFTGTETDSTAPVVVDMQAAPPVFTATGGNTAVVPRNTNAALDGPALVLVRGGAPGLGEALAVN